MHNGTVPYFKQTKRAMLTRVSERAYQLIQGTTDSEMMFAMFVTNFEKLSGMEDECNTYHQDAGNGMDDPYEYIKEKQDYTHNLAAALRATLRQVHYLTLQHEYKNGIQQRPEDDLSEEESDVDGASAGIPLPPTRAIGRLNLAVSDGQSQCTARYVSSTPDTAHTLYYSTGSQFECKQKKCRVLGSSMGAPLVAAAQGAAQGCTAGAKGGDERKRKEVVIVSSEPLAEEFNCQEVPVNHMVVCGPEASFAIESCR